MIELLGDEGERISRFYHVDHTLFCRIGRRLLLFGLRRGGCFRDDHRCLLFGDFDDDRIIRHYTGVIPEPSDLKAYHHLDDRVFVLKLTPEVKANIFYLLKEDYDAIILETFGIGGIPEYDDSFQKAIFDWVDSGKTLAVTTQVPEEGCDLQVYQVGKKYSDYPGILQAGDMTTEAIVAKIMWVLGQTRDRGEIQTLFEKVINLDRQEDIH